MQRGELKNIDDHSPDWNYQGNTVPKVFMYKSRNKVKKTKSCFYVFLDNNKIALNSLTQLKSFLQFMYRQLVIYTRNTNLPVVQQIIPLNQIILPSLIKYSQSIACNMYIERKDHDSEDSLHEVKSTYIFFWSKNGMPLIYPLCY
ncbi:hypothetical protein RFI_32591 [Reticulomyxa filosa]|uniref:Uncharacterized protein n=1 Tax=Reticulomyxa filosa TaxID=46433 RepID=X6LVR8_RETFI|nr:hypothetical protein RFI_32591 [Reticulomyxa filosa]|eukprot:ETO04805.1 hypothetical protein RFI_32591 [Reticulomyxa filosa]